MSWKDAKLTPQGHKDALKANRFWKDAATKDKIPFPGIFYTSPLYRCLQTFSETFANNPALEKSRGVFVSEVGTLFKERYFDSAIQASFQLMVYSVRQRTP
jgi:broad specificity phosphatase PhoE